MAAASSPLSLQQWRLLLARALARNTAKLGPAATYAQLATVINGDRPAVRTVVIRRVAVGDTSSSNSVPTDFCRISSNAETQSHDTVVCGVPWSWHHRTVDQQQQSSTWILITTDSASDKVRQLKENAAAELCIYFADSREQFRLGGSMLCIGNNHPNKLAAHLHSTVWQGLSPRTKATFGGSDNSDTLPPPQYMLLALDVQHVNYVDLTEESQTGGGPLPHCWQADPLQSSNL
ncbi:hypothetical protein RI367_004600 [Sorochytrium milnesiophthora]